MDEPPRKDQTASTGRSPSGMFPQTRWSLVRRATANDTVSVRALGELLKSYWQPLYAFARRSGLDAHDAEDAVQADGKLLLGGQFTSVNGTLRNLIARLTNDPATQSQAATSQVDWTRGGSSPELSQTRS